VGCRPAKGGLAASARTDAPAVHRPDGRRRHRPCPVSAEVGSRRLGSPRRAISTPPLFIRYPLRARPQTSLTGRASPRPPENFWEPPFDTWWRRSGFPPHEMRLRRDGARGYPDPSRRPGGGRLKLRLMASIVPTVWVNGQRLASHEAAPCRLSGCHHACMRANLSRSGLPSSRDDLLTK